MLSEIKVGQVLQFTKDLSGICSVKAGDQMLYCGNNQAIIKTGISKDWIVTLCIDAPVEIISQ